MDHEGTRGMGRLSQEVSELGRSVASFRSSHEHAHEREIELRRSRNRWVITVLIAALAAIEAPLAYLVAHIH